MLHALPTEPLFDHPSCIWWKAQIMKILLM
jgi:hypothetical protein